MDTAAWEAWPRLEARTARATLNTELPPAGRVRTVGPAPVSRSCYFRLLPVCPPRHARACALLGWLCGFPAGLNSLLVGLGPGGT